MKIYLKDILPEGLEVEDKIAPDAIGLTEKDHLHFVSPLSIHAKVQKFEETVLATIGVKGTFESFDYRTSEKLKRDWSDQFDLDFDLDPDRDYIELDEDIRQEIILRIPMRVLGEGASEDAIPENLQAEKIDEEKQKTYQPFKDLKLE